MDPFKWCNRWTFACNIPPTGIFFWTNSRAAWYFFFFFLFFPPSHNITLSPKLLMGLGDKDDWSVVRRKEWLVTIRGLPCRLSISDCFSIIIYDKWLLHTMTFRSSPICHLMPSWFHLIGIALKHFFLPFSFRCSWFCIWFKFAAFPPFSFYPLRFCMGSTIRPSDFKMPSEQCQSCQGSQRLLIGSVSRSVLLIKHLSVSTSYYPAWFFFFFLTCNSLCGLNVWKLISWLPLLGVRGSNGFTVLCLMPCFFGFVANNLLPSCGETENCTGPLNITAE